MSIVDSVDVYLVVDKETYKSDSALNIYIIWQIPVEPICPDGTQQKGKKIDRTGNGESQKA